MPIDTNLYSVQVFPTVNDLPIAPTPSSPGNGSHLIQKHNELVQAVSSNIGSVESSINALFELTANRWIVAIDDYYASFNSKVVFYTNQPLAGKLVYYLYLPENPSTGDTLSFINTNQSIEIELKPLSDEIQFQGNYYQRLYIADSYVQHTIIFMPSIGWISTNNDIYQSIPSNRYNT